MRPDESLLTILAAIDTLTRTADTVFNQITARVGRECLLKHSASLNNNIIQVVKERDTVISLNNRINLARAKVQKLVGTRNATCVFSRCDGQELR